MSTSKPLRILIADDSALVCDVIEDQLERNGHTVVGRAADGRQAVELAQALQPDIVLMDIEMPDVDGLEASRLIQELCPCPVVLLTAHDRPELVLRAGEVGATAYLVKPPNAREMERTLIMAMARYADLRELRRLNAELQRALAEVKTLRGLLPICASCKRIRDSNGSWHPVDVYIRDHTEAQLTHSICPDCMRKLYPDYKLDEGV
jgi:two-component system, response regulator PdtaR